MRVVVAGATGVIGRQLVPLLTASGHEVTQLSRQRGTDLLDRAAVIDLVARTRAEAVVHMATAIPAQINPRRLGSEFALTNRLRTEGTGNLVDAAAKAGTARLIVQGLAWAYRPGDGLADESAPLWLNPPRQFAGAVRALTELEELTGGAGGLVLRFGHLYGPGSAYAPDGSFAAQARARKLPVVGGGGSVFSFVHAADAAAAVASALDRDVTGVLNVVDDTPVAIREWLPAFAAMLDAPAPRRVPAGVAWLAGGGWGLAFMTRLRGASNARARAQLGWAPRYPDWTAGFTAELRRGGLAHP